MNSHEVDYEIIGDDIQIVEVELDPGETVIAEAGAMNYMEDGITFQTKMGDGSAADSSVFSKLLNVGKRALTGESIFMTHFTNEGQGKKACCIRCSVSWKGHCRRFRRYWRRVTLPKRRIPVCGKGNENRNCFYETLRLRPVWREKVLYYSVWKVMEWLSFTLEELLSGRSLTEKLSGLIQAVS